MKYLIMTLVILSSLAARAEWTAEKPLVAKLIGFDKSCAEFQDAEGHKFKVKRSGLGKMKLVPQKTELKYFKESIGSQLCGGLL